METPTLAWIILYVPDVAGSLAFYERAFGLTRKFLHESGTYGELETGGTTLAFAEESALPMPGVRNRFDQPPAGVEVALVVPDVRAAFDRALAAGAAPLLEPTAKPWGQIVSYVRDQDGILVELCTRVG